MPSPFFPQRRIVVYDKEAEILYQALNSEFGIEIEILGNYQASLMRLYAARRKDPDLDILQISRSPRSPTHIWIVKTDRPIAAQSAPALKQNPQGEGTLHSLADLFGDE